MSYNDEYERGGRGEGREHEGRHHHHGGPEGERREEFGAQGGARGQSMGGAMGQDQYGGGMGAGRPDQDQQYGGGMAGDRFGQDQYGGAPGMMGGERQGHHPRRQENEGGYDERMQEMRQHGQMGLGGSQGPGGFQVRRAPQL